MREGAMIKLHMLGTRIDSVFVEWFSWIKIIVAEVLKTDLSKKVMFGCGIRNPECL